MPAHQIAVMRKEIVIAVSMESPMASLPSTTARHATKGMQLPM